MERKKDTAGQSMLGGAMVLTVSMMLVKVIGLLYKMPLATIYNMVGRNYFSNAYEIYLPIYAIAITGLPSAVARMVAQRMTQQRYQEVRAIHALARRLFLVTGAAGTLAMLAIAYPFARFSSTGQLDSIPSMIAIAPTIFFCCAMSSYRGYYEGLRNMIPTAVSQVVEALFKVVVGLVLAVVVMNTGEAEFIKKGTVFGRAVGSLAEADSLLYPWAAAASIVGITLSALAGLIYLILRHRIRGDGITREMLLSSPAPAPRKAILHEMVHIAIPMVLSATILNLTNLIDTFNVNRLLRQLLVKYPDVIERIYGTAFQASNIALKDRAGYIWGLYSNTLDYRTLIPTIVTALGVSALPAISAAWAERNHAVVHKTINSVLRLSLMFALPAGFGLAVLSKEIMTLFYEKSNPGNAQHAAPILMAFGIATAVMAISSPIISLLQGIGRTDIPVKSLIAGTIVKIGTNMLLVSRPEINVNGATVGTILFYVVIVSINLAMLLRVSKTRLKLRSVLLMPLGCAVLSTAAAWAAKGAAFKLAPRFFSSDTMVLATAIGAAIAAAVVVYVVSLLLAKGVTAEDLETMPKAKKIGKALAKFGLLG
ncbi:MAG: polysaccharide biosynthesis protein [Oscillospiraceae bacterium]|nr:polysaccharide biosynthesis protein [Oscillospiraceae bacterium]